MSNGNRLKKRIDHRLKSLLEESIKLNHRSLVVVIGKRGKSQIVNLHWLLERCATTINKSKPKDNSSDSDEKPNVLWCYKTDLGFSPNHVKQVQKIKKEIRRGLRRPNLDDPFESFILGTEVRYVKFRDSDKILGQTFNCLVIQDFEAITPNLLARTVETVAGGGIIVVLLEKIGSLQQLYTMSMDVHKRFRTPAHSIVVPRFNERFTLSLSDCRNCLICDDELNILPLTTASKRLISNKSDTDNGGISNESEAQNRELLKLKSDLKDVKPIGDIVSCARTNDQAKCVLVFLEAIADKSLSSTCVLTAARGRGKSAALGLAVAGAIALQYANIFVTSPTPENLRSFFDILLMGFDALGFKEHSDYEVIQSTNPAFHRAIVRINVFKQHRQTIQYIAPNDAIQLAQAELLVIDEAAAIPLPVVKQLMGPYLVFLSSTINGYEGTGRSLSLKLVRQLRKQAVNSATQNRNTTQSKSSNTSSGGRKLRELSLNEPIRYSENDGVETWLNDLLCLNCCSGIGLDTQPSTAVASTTTDSVTSGLSVALSYHPDPAKCDLYYVNRDTLFSYNKVSEFFLQKAMSLYVSSHYKNQPNDLQLMSDAPAHHLFVLLAPRKEEMKHKKAASEAVSAASLSTSDAIPDILAVIQVAMEGNLTKSIIRQALGQGKRLSGDLIPWIMSQQFQDDDFGRLTGARVVRIAVHPHLQSKGYGTRALQLLIRYFQGNLIDIEADDIIPASELSMGSNAVSDDFLNPPPKKKRRLNPEISNDTKLTELKARSDLPPLLTPVTKIKPDRSHWLGVSYGLSLDLYKFWKRAGFEPVYIRQTANDTTGEYTCVMIKPLENNETSENRDWIHSFSKDFKQRFMSLLSYSFSTLDIVSALSVLNPNPLLLSNDRNSQSIAVSNTADNTDVNSQRNLIHYNRIKSYFSDWDLKRLDKYCKTLYDYRLILDLIPTLTRLFFQCELDIQLNYSQCAILCALGFQHKSLANVSTEMGLILSQTTAMFNKAIRKIQKYIASIVEAHIQNTEVLPTLLPTPAEDSATVTTAVADAKSKLVASMSDPMQELSSELKKAGYKKLKQEKTSKSAQKKARVIGSLKEYDTSQATVKETGMDVDPPSSISIKTGERIIDMPANAIDNKYDPSTFRTKDKASGINPNSKYHWNADKFKGKSKKSKKKKKAKKDKSERSKNSRGEKTYFVDQ